ncbi:LytR/AlgR family response regulator transcription factor [Sphingobacterium sp. NGMCC 1.201703]|uniref:LytR/AlgR family response regulator transcription factor n=1 Tax=Sphingobacterium sp. NGMCC 1.201703 TaxID=3388657 RepID=UPI0039FC6279
MIDCILIEDEPIAKQGIEKHIGQIPFCNLKASFNHAMPALAYLLENEVDLVISDINMPGLNGIDFLKGLSKKPHFIFITDKVAHAADMYDLEVFDFIRKPYRFDRLMRSLLRYKVTFSKQRLDVDKGRNTFYTLKDKYMNYLIPYDQIQYIEGDQEYIKIQTIDKEHLTINSLKKMIDVLPTKMFMRIHKSYIVNLNYIKAVAHDKVVMRNNIKDLPLGKTYKEAVFKELNLR